MRVRSRFFALVAGVSLTASACGLGAGANREALIDILIEEGKVSTEEARCIAGSIYDDSGLDEGTINSLSVVTELDDDADEETRAQYEAYQAAVDDALAECI